MPGKSRWRPDRWFDGTAANGGRRSEGTSVSKDRLQKREAFAALIEKGDYQGYITSDDILTVFPEAVVVRHSSSQLPS